MSYRGSSATSLAPLFVTILCQSGCGTAETAPEPQTTATTSAASARDAQLARDARRLLRRDYGDSASAPSWFPLVQLDKIRAEDGVVTVPTEVGDDADKTGPVNAICAVLAPAAGELDADDVVVTGDDAAGGTVELGRC